jgi:drug/metabolite transporter (DMT)-like permease
VSRALKAHVLLVFITFAWGATFVVIKSALTDITPLYFNLVRMTLAAVLLSLFYWKCFRSMSRAAVRDCFIVGIFLGLGYEFQTAGLVYTTASKSAFLTGLSVVLVPIFLALFWGRRVNRWTAMGVLVAFIGLYLLTVPSSASGDHFSLQGINRGDLLTIGCAVAFGFHIIFIGNAAQKHGAAQTATLQTICATFILMVLAPALEKPTATWSPKVIWAIVITGVLCTAIAFAIQAWAQQFTPPTHTALIFALEPVFGAATSYYVLDERLGWRAAMGAVLILAGIVLSELKGHMADHEASPTEA